MEYLHCSDKNFEDFSSGRVLYSSKGNPNFPVRLLNEIFGRAKAYIDKTEKLVIYDPCCGSGYALSVLGFFYNDVIGKIYGSDIDEKMVEHAKKNISLLTHSGLWKRREELEKLFAEFRKRSHQNAINSWNKLNNMLQNEIFSEIFQADCTKSLPEILPDIILTDVPYGNLVNMEGNI